MSDTLNSIARRLFIAGVIWLGLSFLFGSVAGLWAAGTLVQVAVTIWSCTRDRDASLAEDAERLSPEGVAARAEGIAK